MEDSAKPDFKTGFPADNLPDGGMILGQADGEDVILARRGDELFAVGASCTHYHGPLADGLVVGETVRCPWHHACFSLRTGEALRAPALDPIACWRVERIGDKAYVREKLANRGSKPTLSSSNSRNLPASVVIIGGGAAGLAAADMLRREGYDGPLTIISADDSAPYDRPNLSKDFLAGTASDDWIPLRSPDFYKDRRIELVLGSRVSALDLQQKLVRGDFEVDPVAAEASKKKEELEHRHTHAWREPCWCCFARNSKKMNDATEQLGIVGEQKILLSGKKCCGAGRP